MKIIKIQINFLNSSTLLFLGFLLIAQTNSEIFTHLSQCCTSGTKWAETKTHCLDYDYAIENIPRVWRGLCLSTFGMCCSKELRNQHCLAGRLAAKSGTNCELNIKFNSTSYTDCCKACQIGLAVAASGHNCSSNEFSYFVGDESYTNCCNDMSSSSSSSDKNSDDNNDNTNNNNNNQYQVNSNNEGFNDDEDGVILAEDGDICGKVSNLCSQICENTKDSYVCKCYEGYKLDDNLITCSPINDGQKSPLGHLVTNSGEDDDEIDDEDEDIVDDDERNCKRGFVKDEETDECVDIDECMIGTAKCLTDQYCYNTMGSYNCLNIKSTLCQPGYRFNAKTEECEDIDECLENPCSDGSKCNNYAGGYECRKLTGTGRDNKLPLLHPSIAHGGNVGAGGGGGGGGGGGVSTLARQTYPSINEQKCDPGYRYKNNNCVDIDECLTDKNACDSNQVCTNEQGGYRCDCKIGFKMDATLNACVDINECQINNHNCLPTQRCDNTIGSYTCIRLQSCGTGYTLNAETGNCDDDDECDLGTHNCPPEYVCRNTMGSFKCDRKRYPPNRVYLNRRTSSTSPSTTSTSTSTSTSTTTTTTTSTTSTPPLSPSTTRYTTTTPTPTPSTSTTTTTTTRLPYYPNPSYQSRSYPYTNNPNPYSSSQTNSQLGVDYHPATTHHHRFKLPLEQSNCPYGFQRNHYGACVDINECEIQNACGSHQRCINLNGSYKCQNLLSCPGGYKASNDGTQCVDIDECQTGEHNCGREQTCHNKPGGYVCQCPQGHALNGGRCVDVNECEYPNHVCPINANCINTPGSYYCDCKQGFKKQHSNDKKCDDIDECDEIQGLCEQKCINFWGSYRCSCNLGYELNPMDNRTCNDIDECEVHKSYKLCMGFCINTPGSYECSCPSGYELGTDKMSCRDIDECSQSNICNGPNEICTNIRGSYRCNTIQCPYGYAADPDQKNRCRTISHTCEGEECYQRPSTYTYNFITLVSNMLIPPHGRTLFTLRGPSWYDNIDFDLKIANVNAPRDVERVTDQHFSTTKIHNQVQLNLMRSIAGPQDIELELSMTVFIGGQPRGKSVAIIYIIVSQYSF